MDISVIESDKISQYEEAINRLLTLVFDESVVISINDEFDCAIVIKKYDEIIACGFSYRREMKQDDIHFSASIVAGIAVNPIQRGKGLSKLLMQSFDTRLLAAGVSHSFLFAYEYGVYRSSGYLPLLSPIHYFDKQQQVWNQFVYRGGMVKSYSELALDKEAVIEFNGPVY